MGTVTVEQKSMVNSLQSKVRQVADPDPDLLKALLHLPLPYAVCDGAGRVLACSRAFAAEVDTRSIARSIRDIAEGRSARDIELSGVSMNVSAIPESDLWLVTPARRHTGRDTLDSLTGLP